MDTWLNRGDHGVDGRGLPLAISGDDEWVQQAMIRLCVPRGSFVLDKELGSNFYKINPLQPQDMLEEQALLYAKQALMPMADAQVVWAKCRGTNQGRLEITVKLVKTGKGQNAQLTLTV